MIFLVILPLRRHPAIGRPRPASCAYVVRLSFRICNTVLYFHVKLLYFSANIRAQRTRAESFLEQRRLDADFRQVDLEYKRIDTEIASMEKQLGQSPINIVTSMTHQVKDHVLIIPHTP